MAKPAHEPQWVLNVARHLFKMHVPVPPGASSEFSEAASYGFHFAQIAAVHDRHFTGPHKLSRQKAQKVVAMCKPVLRLITHEVVIALSNRPLHEAANYLRGFASGIDYYLQGQQKAQSGQRDPVASTNAWAVYHALWTNRQHIAEFESVREIYDWLKERYGENVVGELSRFSMLCSRVGLTLRGRGRPRKN